jgi:hypothetical protein
MGALHSMYRRRMNMATIRRHDSIATNNQLGRFTSSDEAPKLVGEFLLTKLDRRLFLEAQDMTKLLIAFRAPASQEVSVCQADNDPDNDKER